ncbi:hypothetical protein [Acidithiobacillus caldus]|uniref:Uncharacterized protein n=1 Tax=Acidithiobacillus caldus (strain SM-1) TaxID=990288 RepID=F9ZU61_ACICS|nr:hypothetical protein [Acidithiobacillus caldus]AEK59680.1 hypothetical protein Atc_m149 [Acidithiobacillus caldus SM-1]QER43356.1 hypothetical protein F0726_00267 [Acidithiobacillus caldus]
MSIDDTIFWSAIFVGVLSLVAVKLPEWFDALEERKNRKKDASGHSSS